MTPRVSPVRPCVPAEALSPETRIGVLANWLVVTAAASMSAAAPAKTTAGVVTTSRKPPAIAPRDWLSVLTVLIPAAAAASSLGVRARTGSIADWAGLYGADTRASIATRIRRGASGAPVAARVALVATTTVRVPAIAVSTRPFGCRSR